MVPVVPVVPVVPGSMRIALNQPIITHRCQPHPPTGSGSVQAIATEEWIVCHTCWPLRRISFAAGLWPSWPYHKKLTTHWRCNWNVLPDLLLDDLLMISWWPPERSTNAFQYALSQDFLSFEFVLRWDCFTFPKEPKAFFCCACCFWHVRLCQGSVLDQDITPNVPAERVEKSGTPTTSLDITCRVTCRVTYTCTGSGNNWNHTDQEQQMLHILQKSWCCLLLTSENW